MNVKRIEKGQVHIFLLILVSLVALLIVLGGVLPITMATVDRVRASTTSGAIANLNAEGYVVLNSGEFSTINAKLDSIASKADAAVSAAQSAVTAAQSAATKVDLFNSAVVYLFPSTTNITVTLTAGNTNVWSEWAQVVDSTSTNLSSKFTAAGYINDMYIYDHSAVDKLYTIELAYGDAKTILGKMMWHTSFKDTVQIKSRRVPAYE